MLEDALYEAARIRSCHRTEDAEPASNSSSSSALRDVAQRRIRLFNITIRQIQQVYYLSMEFLIGRSLMNNVTNLHLSPITDAIEKSKAIQLASLIEEEPDAGLGNGGLGRLAACFIDSLATLEIPAIGYGLRYDFGIFRQDFKNGYQIEHPDNWLARPDPWEVVRPTEKVKVPLQCTFESRLGQISVLHGHPMHLVGVPSRSAGRRLRRQDDQHSAPLAGCDAGCLRLRRIQQRRFLRRRGQTGPSRIGDSRVVPGRFDAAWPLAAVSCRSTSSSAAR